MGSAHLTGDDMTQASIPISIDEAINAKILAVSEDQIAGFYLDEVFGQTGLYAVDNVWPVGPKIAPWGDFVKQGDLRQINGFEYITPR